MDKWWVIEFNPEKTQIIRITRELGWEGEWNTGEVHYVAKDELDAFHKARHELNKEVSNK